MSQSEVASSATFDNIVEQWRLAREVYHEAAVQSVLGDGATYASGVTRVGAEPVTKTLVEVEQLLLPIEESGIGEWMPLMYNLLIVAAIIFYIFCVYRYFDDIAVLFRSVFQHRVVMHDRAEERRHSEIFYGSLGKLFLLGIAFVSVISSMFLRREEGLLNTSQLFYTPFVVVALFVIIVMAQYALMLIIGFVTRSMYEVLALMRIRLLYFVMAVVLVAPILLMSQMGADDGYQGWLGVAQGASLLVLVLYVRESVGFFISKKVSILHWILYLCAVEILPLTLLWQGVIRLA
jgi:magnesium-transporting ATPase (P-type)